MFAVFPLFIHKEGMKGSFKLHTLNSPQPLFKQKRGERHCQASQARLCRS